MSLQRFLLPVTSMLVICHVFILYLWIIDWEKTITRYGIVIWISSTLLGLICYRFYQGSSHKKNFLVAGRVLLVSSLTMIVLGAISLIIEVITSSMP
ncbi:hypothetical protein [Bacillus sp. FJAT-47783]|uniref:hypothetical protein n=1 Tax=Bacillus sp. FJAT-47783 TaxID=2922712 RepID=UPI001FAC0575|nr:hypothetical protein [Bacillus sp. FJAT-47783]